MPQIIIHENNIGGVALCSPTPEMLKIYTINEISLKDTPVGKPFWIVDEKLIPDDHTFFNAWELDFKSLGKPSGYGMNYEDWEKEHKK